MIIVTRPQITDAELEHIVERVEAAGLRTHVSRGERRTIIGCIGDERLLAELPLQSLPGVESVTPVLTPYKLASREFAADQTVVVAGDGAGASVGGRELAIIAGPCSVEGERMLFDTALAVRDAGAGMLRGGAFKPRSSPYSFQGLGEEGLRLLRDASKAENLALVSEVMDVSQIALIGQYCDIFQVGARNMQNFTLLRELGKTRTPVLLKRGISATIEEWLLSAEYILAGGNTSVMLCERGIRTFESYTRNTLDISAIPVVQQLSHLPIIVDPSHGTGRRELVEPMALAGIAAGAHGLILEAHPDPDGALCDAQQSIHPDVLARIVNATHGIARLLQPAASITTLRISA